jgi:hypothetical protein
MLDPRAMESKTFRYPHFPTEEAERDLPELVRIADQVAAAVEAALGARGLTPPACP